MIERAGLDAEQSRDVGVGLSLMQFRVQHPAIVAVKQVEHGHGTHPVARQSVQHFQRAPRVARTDCVRKLENLHVRLGGSHFAHVRARNVAVAVRFELAHLAGNARHIRKRARNQLVQRGALHRAHGFLAQHPVHQHRYLVFRKAVAVHLLRALERRIFLHALLAHQHENGFGIGRGKITLVRRLVRVRKLFLNVGDDDHAQNVEHREGVQHPHRDLRTVRRRHGRTVERRVIGVDQRAEHPHGGLPEPGVVTVNDVAGCERLAVRSVEMRFQRGIFHLYASRF